MAIGKNIKRGGAPKTLGQQVGKITKPIFGERGLADGAIISHWPEIVGTHLAEHAAPERIAFRGNRKNAGVLHLRIDSGGLAMEVQHLAPVIIERLNAYFGFRAVDSLKITQGPLPARPDGSSRPVRNLSEAENSKLLNDLQGIGDDEISDALAALGRAVRGKNPET